MSEKCEKQYNWQIQTMRAPVLLTNPLSLFINLLSLFFFYCLEIKQSAGFSQPYSICSLMPPWQKLLSTYSAKPFWCHGRPVHTGDLLVSITSHNNLHNFLPECLLDVIIVLIVIIVLLFWFLSLAFQTFFQQKSICFLFLNKFILTFLKGSR